MGQFSENKLRFFQLQFSGGESQIRAKKASCWRQGTNLLLARNKVRKAQAGERITTAC